MCPASAAEPQFPAPRAPVVLDFEAIARELHGDAQWTRNGHSARTLAKDGDLRVVFVAMRAGGHIHEHQTEARFTIQALAGHIRVRINGELTELTPGKLLVLDRLLPHDVEAVQDSTFLLSLFWPRH